MVPIISEITFILILPNGFHRKIIPRIRLSAETVFTKNSGCANGASAIFDSFIKRILPFLSASVPGIPF